MALMASEKAKLAKDKGNAAFKTADYPTAIGHYTDAILADGNDHTFFLNRAAAYLKLGKNEDAERDCTKVLTLSTHNVKALFRRGQARRCLGKLEDAQADLKKALVLEPGNESVRAEILELEKLSQQQRLKQRSKLADIGTSKNTTPKRRRVPIEIIESDGPSNETQITAASETKETDLLQPVWSRQLKQEKKSSETQGAAASETKEAALLRPVSWRQVKQEEESHTIPVPPSKPRTFIDAKQAREESKSVQVSGGIFRHTGNHTIVTRTPNENASSTRESTQRPTSTPRPARPPTTLFQFTKSWESLQSDADRWNLIRTISPSSIPALFQVSLEPELLKSILHTFQTALEQDSASDARDRVREYLLAFSKVQRFGTVMLFMDKREKHLLELLREKVKLAQS